jgi:hypothetical protein
MTPAQTAYQKAREAFDMAVEGLSPAEYLEVVQEMASHVQGCEDCLRDESPELFEQ